jgi:hypothetical protein
LTMATFIKRLSSNRRADERRAQCRGGRDL